MSGQETRAISLDDRCRREQGTVYLSGLQALVRLPIDQSRRDRRAELRIGTFITSSCNQDYACLGGDCPSFVTVRTKDGTGYPSRHRRSWRPGPFRSRSARAVEERAEALMPSLREARAAAPARA